MLTPPSLTASFVFAGLSSCVLALLLSRQGPFTPALHFAALITTVLGSVAFVVALRLWGESRLAAKTAAPAPVSTLCGKLTSRKRLLTDVLCSSPVVRENRGHRQGSCCCCEGAQCA